MIVVCISDTHCHHRRVTVPDGDVLVHCGDMSDAGSIDEIASFMAVMARQPHSHRICIAGNHDHLVERDAKTAVGLVPPGVIYATTNSVYAIEHHFFEPLAPQQEDAE